MSGLFGSTILEVVLGLSFVYILLSLLCSSINELLAGFLKLRAKDLDSGIRNLLVDPDLAREVLDHPLIKALGSTRSETIAVQVGAGSAPAAGNNPLRRLWPSPSGISSARPRRSADSTWMPRTRRRRASRSPT